MALGQEAVSNCFSHGVESDVDPSNPNGRAAASNSSPRLSIISLVCTHTNLHASGITFPSVVIPFEIQYPSPAAMF